MTFDVRLFGEVTPAAAGDPARSTLLARLLGESVIELLTRISGLLLSAIAVQLVAEGVRGFVAA